MDDLAAMRKASRKISGVPCATCELESEMTPEHRDTLQQALADPGITSPAVVEWIRENYPDSRLLKLKAPGQGIRRHGLDHE